MNNYKQATKMISKEQVTSSSEGKIYLLCHITNSCHMQPLKIIKWTSTVPDRLLLKAY